MPGAAPFASALRLFRFASRFGPGEDSGRRRRTAAESRGEVKIMTRPGIRRHLLQAGLLFIQVFVNATELSASATLDRQWHAPCHNNLRSRCSQTSNLRSAPWIYRR